MRIILALAACLACGCSGDIGTGDSGDGGASGGGPDAGTLLPDTDQDGRADPVDNCPEVANADQADWDLDGQGDPCDPDPPPVTCGEQQASFTRGKANLLVLLDRSTSMDQNNKWTQATAALDQAAVSLAGDLRFGLALFPASGSQSCGGPGLELAVGDHTTAQIQASYAGASPGGYTPTALALSTARMQGWCSDPADPSDATRAKNILLVTDGKPNCTDADPLATDAQPAIDQATLLHATGISVFVVGFGSGVDATILNDIAQAGGTDNPNDPVNRYYQADNGTELEAALVSIGSLVVSCDLQLTDTPGDPSRVYVKVGATAELRDDPDGFTYDAATNTITLNGAACDALKGSTTPQLEVIFGCPPDGGPAIP